MMGILCLQTTYLHIQMTRTSRGPSATAELLVLDSETISLMLYYMYSNQFM